MIGEVLVAQPGGWIVWLHGPHVLQKRSGRLARGRRAVLLVLLRPVVAPAGRGGRPVAAGEPSEIFIGHRGIVGFQTGPGITSSSLGFRIENYSATAPFITLRRLKALTLSQDFGSD